MHTENDRYDLAIKNALVAAGSSGFTYPPCDAEEWQSGSDYSGGTNVSYNGYIWEVRASRIAIRGWRLLTTYSYSRSTTPLTSQLPTTRVTGHLVCCSSSSMLSHVHNSCSRERLLRRFRHVYKHDKFHVIQPDGRHRQLCRRGCMVQ